ncbi:MAG: TolC family protein, partial [Chthoniobacteraceae bacterium]
MSRPSSFFFALTSALIGLSVTLRADEILHRARPTLHEIKGDLPLDRAVTVALRQNPDILKQLAEIERTRGLVIEARAQALPHLVLTANYDQQDPKMVENVNGQNRNSDNPQEILIQTGPSPGPGQPAPTFDLGQLFSSSS